MTIAIDTERLREALTDMTEVFGYKPPSERAISVWRETLKDLEAQAVLNAIYDWCKSKQKPATPADIRNLAGAWVSRRLEAQEGAQQGTAEDFRDTASRCADPAVVKALTAWRRDLAEALAGVNRDTYWQDALIAAYPSGKLLAVQIDAVQQVCHGSPTAERIRRAQEKVRAQIAREKAILRPFAEYLREARA